MNAVWQVEHVSRSILTIRNWNKYDKYMLTPTIGEVYLFPPIIIEDPKEHKMCYLTSKWTLHIDYTQLTNYVHQKAAVDHYL